MAIPKNINDKDPSVRRKLPPPTGHTDSPNNNAFPFQDHGELASNTYDADGQKSNKPLKTKNPDIREDSVRGSMLTHNEVNVPSKFDPNDPTFKGATIRIFQAGVPFITQQFGTYGDPARSGTGKPASGIAKEIARNPDLRKKANLDKSDYWGDKGNQNNDPYKTGIDDGIEGTLTVDSGSDGNARPLSKWMAGVVVIDSLTMTSPSYVTVDAKGEEARVDTQTIEIQNIMMNVSQKKNIVRTRIAGRDGQVHQYINMDDYVIDCHGKILGFEGVGGFIQGERPEEAIRQFVQFMERPTQLEIGCDFLQIIGVDRAIIADFRLNQEVGKLDNQSFRFKLWSDRPFEIFIEDKIPV